MAREYNLLNETAVYEQFKMEVNTERDKALNQIYNHGYMPRLLTRRIVKEVNKKYDNILKIAEKQFNEGSKANDRPVIGYI